MATQARDKYFLKSLHEEIDLFDRKLAHLQKFETFASDKERDTAAQKMTTKREQLARTARQLAEEGIEFKPTDLPRSFRPEGEIAEAKPAVVEEAPAPAAPRDPIAFRQPDPTRNFHQEVQEYLRNRRKS